MTKQTTIVVTGALKVNKTESLIFILLCILCFQGNPLDLYLRIVESDIIGI